MEDLSRDDKLDSAQRVLTQSKRELAGLGAIFEERLGVSLPNLSGVLGDSISIEASQKSVALVDKVAVALGRYISSPDVTYGIDQLKSELKANLASGNVDVGKIAQSFDDAAKRVESLGRRGWVPDLAMNGDTLSLGMIGKTGVNKPLADFDTSSVTPIKLSVDVVFKDENGSSKNISVPLTAFRLEDLPMHAPGMSPEYQQQLKSGLTGLVVSDIVLPKGTGPKEAQMAFSQVLTNLMHMTDGSVLSLTDGDYGDMSLQSAKALSTTLEHHTPDLMAQASQQMGQSIMDAPALKRIVKNGAEMSEQGQDAEMIFAALKKQLQDNGVDLTPHQMNSLKESVDSMVNGHTSPSEIQDAVNRIVRMRDQQLQLVLEKPKKHEDREDMDLALSAPRLTPSSMR